MLNTKLLQIQTVGPEGYKVFWLLLFIVGVTFIIVLIRRKIPFHLSDFSSKVSVTLEKNKIYHPTVVQFTIFNKSEKAIVIENPVLRFRRGRRKRAYKITSVKTKEIYPLYLEPNKTHCLPVTLQPFYDHNKRLKRLSRLRVEFYYNKTRFKSSKYILLKPTLFRKEK